MKGASVLGDPNPSFLVALKPITGGGWPGVYVFEDTDGYVPTNISDHANCVMIGSASTGANLVPTQVASVDDFKNVFGTSPSLGYVERYFAADPNGSLFFVRINGTGLTLQPYLDAITVTVVENAPQSILIVPEGLARITVATERTTLAIAMRDACANEDTQWLAYVDCAQSSNTAALVQAERNTIPSALGHVAFFGNWLRWNGVSYPPSPTCAGIATKRWRQQGFYQAPAGLRYILPGIDDVAWSYENNVQGTLNQAGINIVRKFPDGIALWGARTTSTNPAFRFINQRVTFNVVNRTIKKALRTLVFDVVDGQGFLFRRIRDTVNAVLFRLYEAGALYGKSANDAYKVVCDATNNPALDLENGIVRVDAYAIPSPTAERIVARPVRVPIGFFTLTSDNEAK
jgi:hypothetical protein